MTEKMIRDAYARIRTIDQTIPDDVLDFMKDAAIEKLNAINFISDNPMLATGGCRKCGSRNINGGYLQICEDCGEKNN